MGIVPTSLVQFRVQHQPSRLESLRAKHLLVSQTLGGTHRRTRSVFHPKCVPNNAGLSYPLHQLNDCVFSPNRIIGLRCIRIEWNGRVVANSLHSIPGFIPAVCFAEVNPMRRLSTRHPQMTHGSRRTIASMRFEDGNGSMTGFALIGMGPGRVESMTVEAVEVAKNADIRLYEAYTALWPEDELSKLEG